jgi:hypothetical protein
MALTAIGWKLVVGMADRGGKVVNRTFDLTAVDTAGDASAVLTDVATILSRLNGVSALVIKSYSVAKVYSNDALTLPTSAEAEAEQQLHLSALIIGDPTKSGTYDIPGPEQLCFQAASGPGADLPNFGQTELNVFVDIFDSGASDLAHLSDGESWDGLTVKGKKTHKHSTNG